MANLTNLPMRTVSEELGCGLTVTEFIAAAAMVASVPKELDKLQPSRGGRAFSVQIFGRDPGQMARAAAIAVERGAALVDINMGCPARKVTKSASGGALMREPALAEQLVRGAVEAVGDRALVTVKMRAGWDDDNLTAPELAARLVDAGARAITVHGRTVAQRFTGHADLKIIARVKQAVDVPVIGNGDVTDEASLQRMFEQTGCDGVMIGRAALGNPWIFARALAWWEGREAPAPHTPADQLAMFLRHLELYLSIASGRRATIEMRKFAGWYLRGFHGASALRKQIYALEQVEAVRDAVCAALESWDRPPTEVTTQGSDR